MSNLYNLQVALITLLLLVITSCTEPTAHNSNTNISIVTTTGMLGDVVSNITPSTYQIKTLMGPGVDPHLYRAVQSDLNTLSDADIIIYNGLHLEGKMNDIFEKLERTKHVICGATPLSSSELRYPDSPNTPDPHIWFDLTNWIRVTEHISSELIKHSPKDSSEIRNKTAIYTERLDSLHQAITKEILSIPKQQRILITAHDAFGYFGDRYNIDVKGIQGISTVSQAGIKDVESIIQTILDRKINAIFVESSISPKQLETIVEACKEEGHEIVIGGELYSDAMGSPNSKEGTYIGMVAHNVNVITKALK